MSDIVETHEWSTEEFDLRVSLDTDGNVRVSFHLGEDQLLAMDWDTMREVIDFIGKHGLGMRVPMFVEFDATLEGAEGLNPYPDEQETT